jgi:hypothetical protein
MFTAQEEKLIELLGWGITQIAAANALGISDSRVSQLMAKPEFANRVSAAKIVNLESGVSRDKNYDSLEDKLLEKLNFSLDALDKPMQIIRAIQVINAAKRTKTDTNSTYQGLANIVNITLPTQVINNLLISQQNNQVLAIEGKELTPMNSAQLERFANDSTQKSIELSQTSSSPKERYEI